MRRRGWLAVALLAVLVALAGCGAVGDGGAGDDGTQQVDYPAGYDDSGVADPGVAVDAHHDALVASGSWRTVYDVDVAGAEGLAFREERRVDVAGGPHEHVTVTGETIDQDVYATADGVSQRLLVDGQFEYDARDGGVERRAASGADRLEPLLAGLVFAYASSETVDGVERLTYEATAVVDGSALAGADGQRVEDVEATLVVGADGIVYEFRAAGDVVRDGETRSFGVELTVSDVAATSVHEPGWVEDARDGATGG